MAYIGLEPSNSFVSLNRQVITGDGTASYTLDHSVASVNDVAIFVNNVRQDPAGYSISGAALTLGGTIESSDNCYVIFLGQALQTVTPDSDTITTAMLKSNAVTSAKLGSNAVDTQVLSLLNASGSAPVFGCRAWVNFDGDASTPSIRASGNVSSITDNATGDYTVNFTTAMQDANYCTQVSINQSSSARLRAGSFKTDDTYSTTAVQIICEDDNSASDIDRNKVCVAVFR